MILYGNSKYRDEQEKTILILDVKADTPKK